MNSRIFTFIIIVIVLIGGLIWIVSGGGEKNNVQNVSGENGTMMGKEGDAMEGEMMKEDGTMMEEEGSMMKEDGMQDEGMMEEKQTKGSYETYSPEKLAKAENGDVVLFFRASWCPTCRALDANIRSNVSSIPNGLTILDVDYDNSTTLKQKYGVTYQHTLVQVDAQGNLIHKWMGSSTLSALSAQVK